jgi:type II secretory pathway component PulF
MGKFEETMEKMAGISQEEMQNQIAHVKEICKDYIFNVSGLL